MRKITETSVENIIKLLLVHMCPAHNDAFLFIFLFYSHIPHRGITGWWIALREFPW